MKDLEKTVLPKNGLTASRGSLGSLSRIPVQWNCYVPGQTPSGN